MAPNKTRCIRDCGLMTMARRIPPSALEHIAVEYMDISHDEIKFYKDTHRENTVLVNFSIFEQWRNQNDGPQAKTKLLQILQKASKEGQISEESYAEFSSQSQGNHLVSCL